MDTRPTTSHTIHRKYNFEQEIEIQRSILDEDERDPFVITFYMNAQDYIYGFIAKGTTGFTQYGYDIIAASVSVLTINTINSINEFTEDEAEIEQSKHYAKCIINGRVSKDAHLLLKSLRFGMYSIQNTYGNRFITIEEVKLERNKRFFGLL
ncbi:ribosomal-processing cysteine protease Prp [Paenibacillus glycanilyticus]|uniref:Ribosomal processing cysteine protease Prp n=1 Tax=Paenibacillus glycanilyticus TaxID=126569 RepID=A0ABQ6GHT7_9BACL|nr:ribosomal-processing cysteine protease Prp [Paenibacillus glycanilyticus]GLX70509.1 hypothetical protein MU1_48550 [Paenibacillus glycanilyticus]